MGAILGVILDRLRSTLDRAAKGGRPPADPPRPAHLRFSLWAEPGPRGTSRSDRLRERESARRSTHFGPPPA